MTNDLIERLNMIVAELQGLPHVVQTCREAAAHIEAQAERVREMEESKADLMRRLAWSCHDWADYDDEQARKDKEEKGDG
jgi:hypothetical protein